MKDKTYLLTLVVSILYFLYGSIQFYNGLIEWWFSWTGLSIIQLGFKFAGTYIPNTFPEAFSGVFLIIIGAVFTKALYLYSKGEREYRGFLFVGWLLSMLMLLLNLTVLFADILDTYYPLLWGGSIEKSWSLAGDTWGIAPHFIIGVIASPMYWSVKDLLKELLPGKA